MNSKYEYTHLRYDIEIGWHWVTLIETNIKLKCFQPTKVEDLEKFTSVEVTKYD